MHVKQLLRVRGLFLSHCCFCLPLSATCGYQILANHSHFISLLPPTPCFHLVSLAKRAVVFLPDLHMAAGWQPVGSTGKILHAGIRRGTFATHDLPFTMQCLHIHVFSTKPEGGIFLRHPKSAPSKPQPEPPRSPKEQTKHMHILGGKQDQLLFSLLFHLPWTPSDSSRTGSFSPSVQECSSRHGKAHRKASPLWRGTIRHLQEHSINICIPARQLPGSIPAHACSLQAPHPGEM